MDLTIAKLKGTKKETFEINKLTLDASALTVNRTVSFPDKAGTVAMTSDLSATGDSLSGFLLMGA